jgi:hypothetical protein
VAIQTPDQRIRVFVSSTMQELAQEWRAVREAIESLRLTPVMFELGARPHPPRALYRAYLEQSDVFVGLYWESYGGVPPGEDLSGLEDEYRLSGDRPKLIYVKTPVSGRQPLLDELIARIQRDDSASYRPFGLGSMCAVEMEYVGRSFLFDYVDMVIRMRYVSETTLQWEQVEGPDAGLKGEETYGFSAVRPNVYFIWCQQKDTSVVTQVVDFDEGRVHTTWTSPDKALMAFQGTIRAS